MAIKQIVSKSNLGKWIDIGVIETKKINPKLPLINPTSITFVPTATGNTTNLNEFVKDSAGDVWFIDYAGNAVKFSSATADIAYSKMLFVDAVNGNDTTGTGSDNNMFKTITKALSVASGTGYRIVLAAGIYAESPTISLANIDIVTVAGSDRGNTTIQGTVTFTHTSSSSGIQGIAMTNLVHSGAGALYVTDCQINTLLNKTSAAYIEITDSQLQGTATSTLSAGTGLIKECHIANMTISGAASGYTLKSNLIDANGAVTFTGGAFYNIQDNSGNIITTAGINMETGLIASGLSADLAKQYVTDFSTKLGMINPDTNTSPTKFVTWNETTKRLEVSDKPTGGALWYSGTATPAATGNTALSLGIASLPANYVNTATGNQYYVDANGVSKLIEKGYITTSLTPVYGTGTAYTDASNTALATVADQMELSGGEIVDDVDVTWTGHGLTVHAWYYLDAATGGYTTVKPTTGFIQQLFFVKDANTIHIDVEQAAEVQTASAVTTTVTYGTAAPTGTAATGSEYFITSTGTNGGTITASYVFDGTTWVLRPSSSGGGTVTAKVTTSLVVQYGNGSSHVNALATAATTVADVIKLSDGSLVNNEDIVTWTSHGLTLHAWYFLSDTVAGGYTTTPPLAPNYSQRLFYIVDANTVKINVQEAVLGYDATSGAGGQFWSINSAIGTEIAVDNFTLRVAPTGNVALQIKANTGTLSMQGQGQIITNATITPYGYNAASVTTTYSYFSTSVNATAVPWGEFIYLHDNTNDRTYEVRMQRRTSSGVTPVVCVITVIRLR